MPSLSSGQVPGTARLAVAMGIVAFGLDLFAGRRSLHCRAGRTGLRSQYPAARGDPGPDLFGSPAATPPIAVNIALSLLIVAAIGLFLYRIAFAPLAHTSVLVLLIASVGCHLALQGFGLLFFGAEGQRGPPLSNAAFTVGPLRFTGQSIAVYAITIALIVGLWLFFGFTLYGKALARHRRQSARRAPGRHPNRAVGTDRVPAGLGDRRDFGNPDRADHDAVLRHRLPDRPEGLRRRDHRRPRQLSA